MKKLVSLLLTVVMIFSLSLAGSGKELAPGARIRKDFSLYQTFIDDYNVCLGRVDLYFDYEYDSSADSDYLSFTGFRSEASELGEGWKIEVSCLPDPGVTPTDTLVVTASCIPVSAAGETRSYTWRVTVYKSGAYSFTSLS